MKRLSAHIACVFCLVLSAPSEAETLTEIYELALQNDPQLRAASAAYRAQRENKAIARAGLLPQASLSGEYSETDSEDQSNRLIGSVTSVSDGESETDQTSYGLSVRQPVFDLPAWYDYKQGQTVSEQARVQLQAEQQDLIVRVTDAYFEVLNASENLNSAIAEEQAIARQLEQTRQRYEVGLLPITDVHEAQAAYDSAKVNTLVLQGALKIAFEQLEVLTGQSHNQLAGLKDDFPALPPDAGRDEWVQVALENNLSLKLSRLDRTAARQNADARKAEHLPTLTASYNYQDMEQDSLFDGISSFGGEPQQLRSPTSVESQTSTVAISLDMPIFTGGLVSAQRRQAVAQYLEAEENANFALRNTTQQTRSAHLNVVTNAAAVAARKQAITSAESALEATRAGYEVGTRNIVDLLFAEQSLYQAKRDYANARYDYIASSLELKLLAGQLSPEDVHQLNAWLDPGQSITPSVEK